MTYEFATHHITDSAILSIRDQVPADAFPAFLGVAFPELFEHVGRHGIAVTGHPFVIYHAFGPDDIDAEVCVPVAGPAPVGGRVGARTLAGGTIVRTLHVGPYEELGSAYAALQEWVGDHGYVAVGPHRERYLNGPDVDVPPSEYRTEVDLPVESVTAQGGADEPARDREPAEVG